MRRVPVLVAVLVVVPVLHAEDAPHLTARAEVRRRYLWIGADATLAGVASGAQVTARVRRGGASALEEGATVGDKGSLHVELRTTARLLPDDYDLEIAQGDRTLATTKLRVGAPEEVEPARGRLKAWLVNARAALRGIAAGLERNGAFHRRRLLDEAKASGGRPNRQLVEAQSAAWNKALEKLSLRYRMARMDFVPYEREVLLSPFPEAGGALAAIFPALLARRDELRAAFEEALAGRDSGLGEPTALLETARLSAVALGLDGSDTEDWKAGPLSVPESGKIENGRFTSVLGASLDLPAGWIVVDRSVSEDDNPEERIRATSQDGASFWLYVRELPDPRAAEDLEHATEMFAWEEWGNFSFKKTSAEKGESSYKLLATYVQSEQPYRLVILERAPASGKRIFSLRETCREDAWSARKADLEKVAASFVLDEKK